MLTIQLNQINVPFILDSWKEKDFKVPLNLDKGDYRARLYLSCDDSVRILKKLPNHSLLLYGILNIYIENPSKKILAGLNQDSYEEVEYTANYIFNIYREVIKDIAGYARLSLNLQNIIQLDSRYDDLFKAGSFSSSRVYWKENAENYKVFEFEIKSKGTIHPEFQPEKLITPKKWKELQVFINKNPPLTKEIEELLFLRQKTAWNEKRLATIESATIIEFILKKKVEKVLLSQGVSHNKLKEIKREIGMSILLNLLIPLSINKKEYESQKEFIDKVDKLRKIRNEIIHDGLEERDIPPLVVSEGINSAIALLSFLDKKFK